MLVHRCLGSLLLLVEKVKVPRHGLIQAICYSVCRLIVQQFFALPMLAGECRMSPTLKLQLINWIAFKRGTLFYTGNLQVKVRLI